METPQCDKDGADLEVLKISTIGSSFMTDNYMCATLRTAPASPQCKQVRQHILASKPSGESTLGVDVAQLDAHVLHAEVAALLLRPAVEGILTEGMPAKAGADGQDLELKITEWHRAPI